MNLYKLYKWTIVVVKGNLDKLTHWIYRAQTKVIYELHTLAWANPSVIKLNSKR